MTDNKVNIIVHAHEPIALGTVLKRGDKLFKVVDNTVLSKEVLIELELV